MVVIDEIREKVRRIAEDRNLSEEKAFGYWFLEEIEDLSIEDAELTILDGPWDRGRDAVYYDEENRILKIYQFKYTENMTYLRSAFQDIQRAIQAEYEDNNSNIHNAKTIRVYIVTLATSNKNIETLYKNTLRRIRTWLTRHGYTNVDVDIEIFDLKKFAQMFERIYGVDISLEFKSTIDIDRAVIGLVNASKFKEVADREELFAFNIRKFIGLRKGSVNWQINESLEDENLRREFWMLNNGIVCLCTDFERISDNKYHFENFTIVNGAQTISTIAKFLERNPTVEDPIWVLSKIIKVEENDIEKAFMLTKTSNTQTPTSNKDLRAIDVSHRRLKRWFKQYFDIEYIYRRGERVPRSQRHITMKEMSQAFVAYWLKEPHVSFSRPGKIFADSDYYDEIFPSDEIEELKEHGSDDEILKFLLKRILPYEMLMRIRFHINQLTKEDEKKWRSLSYHILWVYREIFDILDIGDTKENLEILLKKQDRIIDNTINSIYEKLKTASALREMDIPKDLKSERFMEEIRKASIFSTLFKDTINEISKILDS